MPAEEYSKLHYHDVDFQMVYVLKGWIKTAFDGQGAIVMRTGSCWIQPPRIEHEVLDYSDDCEVLEVVLPAISRPSNSNAVAGDLLRRFASPRGVARVVDPALDDARRLAAAAAQIIELGAAYLAAAHDLDRVDHRRIKREDALDAFAVGNLAHGEILVQPGAGAADADALIGLDAAALAFDDLDVDHDRIARLEFGDFLAGGELRHLFVFDLL